MEPAATPPNPLLPANARPALGATPNRAGRLARLILLRALRWPYLAGRALAPHRLSLTVIAALLALSGWLGGQLYLHGALAAGPVARPAAGPAAAEAFLSAQEQFDTAAMWAALSPAAQQQLAAGGETQLTWQARAELEQRAGLSYAGHRFVGESALPDGSSIAFYLEQVESGAQGRAELLPLAFRLDPDGKILRVGHIN